MYKFYLAWSVNIENKLGLYDEEILDQIRKKDQLSIILEI